MPKRITYITTNNFKQIDRINWIISVIAEQGNYFIIENTRSL